MSNWSFDPLNHPNPLKEVGMRIRLDCETMAEMVEIEIDNALHPCIDQFTPIVARTWYLPLSNVSTEHLIHLWRISHTTQKTKNKNRVEMCEITFSPQRMHKLSISWSGAPSSALKASAASPTSAITSSFVAVVIVAVIWSPGAAAKTLILLLANRYRTDFSLSLRLLLSLFLWLLSLSTDLRSNMYR